ncbi:MAG: thiamine pyrophosphate-dependent dehydrogenase E1 component subunit alpha [Chlamydiota bacterium]|jgi:pyruvate dehydrogenase E1 component alpha subunit
MTILKTSNSIQLFTEMLRIRMVEESIADRYKEQKMRCPTHLSIGQEAVAVGVCKAALHTDYMLSNHRAHAHYLAKGGSLKKMIAEIYGKETGCSKGHGGSMHLVDLENGVLGTTPIVGGSIPVGVGTAFHSYLQKDNKVTIVFFGEGSTEEGVWAESLNFSALKKLPVLFVCENNFYSVYSPLKVRQPSTRSRIKIAEAHGISSSEGDGNNVEEVFLAASHAIDEIRKGNGPFYLEFTTYRYREHCGPNFDLELNYRSQEEFDEWVSNCPIKRSEKQILENKLLTEVDLKNIRSNLQSEINEAFNFANNSPFPQPRNL